MHRTAAMAAVMVVVSIVSTGCSSGDIDVTVRDDGSGEVRLEVFPSPQLRTALGGVDVESLAGVYLDGVDGGSFEPIVLDGKDGYRVVVPFDDVNQLTSVLVDGASVAGQQVRLFSSIDLRQIGDGWRLDAVLAPEIVSSALTAPPGLEELLATDGRAALDSNLNLSITLPGEVTNSNADEISGGTALWRLKEFDGETQLRIVTRLSPFPTNLQKVLAGVGSAVLVGLLMTSWAKSRTRRSDSRRRAAAHSATPADSDAAWRRPVESFTGVAASTAPVPELVLPTIDMSPRSDVAAPTASDVSPGWYSDPDGSGSVRWWDGEIWTDHLS